MKTFVVFDWDSLQGIDAEMIVVRARTAEEATEKAGVTVNANGDRDPSGWDAIEAKVID